MHIVQSAVLLLLLFLVVSLWNIQLKHKTFNWHHPIQCCKMKISKISDIYGKYPTFSIFSKILQNFPSLTKTENSSSSRHQRSSSNIKINTAIVVVVITATTSLQEQHQKRRQHDKAWGEQSRMTLVTNDYLDFLPLFSQCAQDATDWCKWVHCLFNIIQPRHGATQTVLETVCHCQSFVKLTTTSSNTGLDVVPADFQCVEALLETHRRLRRHLCQQRLTIHLQEIHFGLTHINGFQQLLQHVRGNSKWNSKHYFHFKFIAAIRNLKKIEFIILRHAYIDKLTPSHKTVCQNVSSFTRQQWTSLTCNCSSCFLAVSGRPPTGCDVASWASISLSCCNVSCNSSWKDFACTSISH